MDTDLPHDVQVVLDQHAMDHYASNGPKAGVAGESSTATPLPLNGVENLDFGYTAMKDHVEKSKSLLSAGGKKCAVCASYIRIDDDLLFREARTLDQHLDDLLAK